MEYSFFSIEKQGKIKKSLTKSDFFFSIHHRLQSSHLSQNRCHLHHHNFRNSHHPHHTLFPLLKLAYDLSFSCLIRYSFSQYHPQYPAFFGVLDAL